MFHKRISLKFAILSIKYGEDSMKKLTIDDSDIKFGENTIDSFKKNKTILIIDKIFLDKKKHLMIEGRFAAWLKASFPKGSLKISDGENEFVPVFSYFNNEESTIFGDFQRFEKFTVETEFSEKSKFEFFYDSGDRQSIVYINYNPLMPNGVDDEALFTPIGEGSELKAKRKRIEIETPTPEKFKAAERKRDYYIKTRNFSLFQLRKGRSSSKKQLILAVGKNAYSDEFLSRLSKKHGIDLYTFTEPDERYKKYYLLADRIIIFDPELLKKSVVFFGKDQVLVDDLIHFDVTGVFDGDPKKDIHYLTTQEYILNSKDDIKGCVNKIKRW